MALHESGEMYLETIYVLSKERPAVRAIDVGEHMGFSKPSVSRALSLLKESGHVTVDANGHLSLTETGTAVAEKIFERHTILTRIIMALGVDEETTSNDACKMEHVISDRTFEAFKKHLAEKGTE
ncbi:MAG: metal-dependent transcriptional regulator [Firmicutes bacterium]|nr:metal-dependent transcriptional regulator [Bacillota bacterium]